MDTPTQELAARIAARLVGEGLLTGEAAKKLQSKLASGSLSAEEWRLSVELSDEKKDTP